MLIVVISSLFVCHSPDGTIFFVFRSLQIIHILLQVLTIEVSVEHFTWAVRSPFLQLRFIDTVIVTLQCQLCGPFLSCFSWLFFKVSPSAKPFIWKLVIFTYTFCPFNCSLLHKFLLRQFLLSDSNSEVQPRETITPSWMEKSSLGIFHCLFVEVFLFSSVILFH